MNINTNTYALLIQGPIISIGQGSYKYKSYLDKNVKIIHFTILKYFIGKLATLYVGVITK